MIITKSKLHPKPELELERDETFEANAPVKSHMTGVMNELLLIVILKLPSLFCWCLCKL